MKSAKIEHEVGRYGLRMGLGTWEVTLDGQRDSFGDEQGAAYVVWLLLHPPPQPIYAVALTLEAGYVAGWAPGAAGVIQQRNLGLDDAAAVRDLRRQARQFAAVLEDQAAGEPAKAEARRKREDILEFLRRNSWRTQDNAQRCVRAVTRAIKRFHARLERGEDAEGQPHPVLQAFAEHLWKHLLVPSGRGGARGVIAPGGCFTYEPPPGVVWRRVN